MFLRRHHSSYLVDEERYIFAMLLQLVAESLHTIRGATFLR